MPEWDSARRAQATDRSGTVTRSSDAVPRDLPIDSERVRVPTSEVAAKKARDDEE